jgi:hypothetical protein
MPRFIYVTEKSEKAEKYMKETDARLRSSNMIKNPFTGYIKKIYEEDNNWVWEVNIEPIYMKFYWLGAFMLIPYLIFKGFVLSLWLILPLIILSCRIFWTEWMYRKLIKIQISK